MRRASYPGSDLVIEQTLEPGSNYLRYIVSYRSERYKIEALFTVSQGPKPASGWPVILFNHGYIPPEQYRSAERYVAYVDAFARNGYIVLRVNSQGSISFKGRRPFVAKPLANEEVAVQEVDDKLLVMYRHSFVREVNPKTGETRAFIQPIHDGRYIEM